MSRAGLSARPLRSAQRPTLLSVYVRVGPAAATCPVEVLTKSEALCEDGSVANKTSALSA